MKTPSIPSRFIFAAAVAASLLTLSAGCQSQSASSNTTSMGRDTSDHKHVMDNGSGPRPHASNNGSGPRPKDNK